MLQDQKSKKLFFYSCASKNEIRKYRNKINKNKKTDVSIGVERQLFLFPSSLFFAQKFFDKKKPKIGKSTSNQFKI